MATDIKEAIRRLTYEFVTEGADQVIAAQEKIAATTTTTDKAALSLEKAFGGLERKYVDTVRHQQDYAKVQEKVNAAVAQNPALQERANAVLAAASEHFDKLSFNANKGGIATSFLSKAISALLGPAGLMGAAMTGIGVAVGYMASQFTSSSRTVEQVLEDQNRLLKEASLQSKDMSQYQAVQNHLELQQKLNAAIAEQVKLGERLVSRPTQVAGEMGEAPTGLAAAQGYEKIYEAFQKMQAAIAAGQPALQQYANDLGAIGLAQPELKKTVDEMIKGAAAAVDLERAVKRAADAVNSLAQSHLRNLIADEAAEAAERMAKAVLNIALAYPTMSVEIAKQLFAMNDQLRVAQARTGAERMAAQALATQNQLLAQGKTLEEAMAVAAKQREIAQAQVNSSIDQQIKSLNQQVELIEAAKNGTEAMVKAQHAYTNAVEAGASAGKAQQLAAATARAEEARHVSSLAQEEADRARQKIQQEQELAAAHRANAQAVAQANAQFANWYQQQRQAYADLTAAIGFSVVAIASFDRASGQISVRSFGDTQYWTRPDGGLTQFNPAGYASTPTGAAMQLIGAQQRYGEGGFTTPPGAINTRGGVNIQATAQGVTNVIDKYLGKGGMIQGAISQALAEGDVGIQIAQQLISILPKDQQASAIQQVLGQVRAMPRTLASEQLISQLTQQLEGLTQSTDALNSTMQSALSPYYSMDPRTTKLGFRAGVVGNPDWLTGAANATALDAILGKGATAPGMASGGSFIVGGGYSASDNRIAQFPVASGEQVIVNRRPQDASSKPTVINQDNRIIIQGSVGEDTLSKLKVSRYQQAQRMRSAMG